MLQSLVELDKNLFLLFNGMHNASFDYIMVAISNKWIWIPLYAYLLFVVIKTFKVKSLYLILLIAMLVTLSDQASVQLFKNVFMRLRPCHEPGLDGLVHIVNNHCGGQFGFVSSHASNVFGLAVFFGKVLKPYAKGWMMFLLIWASIVSYSRIYLGVHYPGDILGGALLGSLIAQLLFIFLKILDDRYTLNIIKP